MRRTRGPRVDGDGRAYAGSQLQIQIYANRRGRELSEHVCDVLPGLSSDTPIHWVSPVEAEKFVEYQDSMFLRKLGLTEHSSALRTFWPRGGPVWDALAVVVGTPQGSILVEAKSHAPEVYGSGCQAKGESRRKIEAALAETKQWLGVSSDTDWMGPLYQSANRIAHLYFLREVLNIPAWLVNVYFVDDPHSPTTREQWETAIGQVRTDLGLTKFEVPHMGEVFLKARDRSELLGNI